MNRNINTRVAIIGAGCSGITALKNCLEVGLTQVQCFEQNSEVGGNWIFTAGEGHSSVCETTHIISSKKMSEYRDFPMPEDYPDYPSHRQVLAYFQSYARHFGLYDYIRFNIRVKRAIKRQDETWQLTLDDGSTHDFDFLLVANGHHNAPRHPEDIKATFTGRYLHSHAYKSNASFTGEKVLVIGGGNSACDCAVEISRVAESVDISIRRPRYIIPKFFLGQPTDTFNKGVINYLPNFLREPLRKLALRIQVGRYRDYGLEEPTTKVTEIHPTLNSELLYKIRHGKVQPRRGINGVEGNQVTFSDGTQSEYDSIVAATGYRIATPFFDADFLNYEEADRIPLWLRMFHPDHPSLVFIGLFQPQGAIWPYADLQGELAAHFMVGAYDLPGDLVARAEADSDEIQREFAPGKQHTVEVHVHPFERKLQKEIAKAASPKLETA